MTAQRKIRKPSRTSRDAMMSNTGEGDRRQDGYEAGADAFHALDAAQILVRVRVFGTDLLRDLHPVLLLASNQRSRSGAS